MDFLHHTLLEEKVLYRTLKGSISATYLEPLKVLYRTLSKGSIITWSFPGYMFHIIDKHQEPKMYL